MNFMFNIDSQMNRFWSSGLAKTGGGYGDDHWKWHVSGGLVLGANETREFIIGSLGATRKGGVETRTTQEWHLL